MDTLRNAWVRILYNSVDMSPDISPFTAQVEFTDGIEKADDLQITVQDDGRWRTYWAPEHGAKLQADIFLQDASGTVRLPCGLFVIDEPQYSGPPATCTIKATSAWVTTA